jgi:hypothetical protein
MRFTRLLLLLCLELAPCMEPVSMQIRTVITGSSEFFENQIHSDSLSELAEMIENRENAAMIQRLNMKLKDPETVDISTGLKRERIQHSIGLSAIKQNEPDNEKQFQFLS